MMDKKESLYIDHSCEEQQGFAPQGGEYLQQ